MFFCFVRRITTALFKKKNTKVFVFLFRAKKKGCRFFQRNGAAFFLFFFCLFQEPLFFCCFEELKGLLVSRIACFKNSKKWCCSFLFFFCLFQEPLFFSSAAFLRRIQKEGLLVSRTAQRKDMVLFFSSSACFKNRSSSVEELKGLPIAEEPLKGLLVSRTAQRNGAVLLLLLLFQEPLKKKGCLFQEPLVAAQRKEKKKNTKRLFVCLKKRRVCFKNKQKRIKSFCFKKKKKHQTKRLFQKRRQLTQLTQLFVSKKKHKLTTAQRHNGTTAQLTTAQRGFWFFFSSGFSSGSSFLLAFFLVPG